MNGLLNVNKPLGHSSHDVIRDLRRLTNFRRIGHTGTLDPMATGVLVLVMGAATRLARFVTGSDKRYRAVVHFGEETATYDVEGEVISRCEVTFDRAQLDGVLEGFRGPLLQIPPMYSAIRVKGQRLYELARRGEDVVREPRPVTIHELEVLAWEPPELTLDVLCSPGTYIRSLAHDLGEALECGAHLRSLVRTATGPFRLEESYTLEDLAALAEEGRLEDALLPPKAALYALPAVQLTDNEVQAVRYGQAIALDVPEGAEVLQARDQDDRLVAVMVPQREGRWRPSRVMPAEDPG